MSSISEVELAVSARWIIPIVPRKRVLTDCSLVVDKGKIIAVCPQSTLMDRYAPQKHLQLGAYSALLPGLINAHGHCPMTLLRGFADDLPLKQWLEEHIWPAEQRWVSPEFVEDGARLASAEMLLSGTTTFSDMYFYPEAIARVANSVGMRAQLNAPVFDFATAWAADADSCIHKTLEIRDEYRAQALINIGFGPHAPYTVSNNTLNKIATYVAELQMSVHIHLHETAEELKESIQQFGQRPINRLAELGILGPTTQCVHFTQASDADIDLLLTWGAHVIHCPQSNLKLASGFSPVHTLTDKGINLALGTDGAASNNGLNMFSEMKFAALLAKAVANRADVIDAATALEMATINGARALGLEDQIGSLEPGKSADFIAVDLNNPQYAPNYDLVSQLVYTDMGHNVTHAWVNGQTLMENRQLLTLDLNEVMQKAKIWQAKIATR